MQKHTDSETLRFSIPYIFIILKNLKMLTFVFYKISLKFFLKKRLRVMLTYLPGFYFL